MNLHRILPVVALLICAIAPAAAHPGHGDSSFATGFSHPFLGLDHVLAMVAVGLMAARLGGAGRWWLPLTFVGFLVIGGGIAGAGAALPAVEIAIALSVIALGAMLMMAKAPHAWIAGAVVALVAIPHGYAHIMESTGAVAGYTLGMAAGTALLHAFGLGAGVLMARGRSPAALRVAGFATAVVGLVITVGLIAG